MYLSLVPFTASSAVCRGAELRTLVTVLPLSRGTEGDESPGFCLTMGQWGEQSPCSLSFCPLCSLSPPPASHREPSLSHLSLNGVCGLSAALAVHPLLCWSLTRASGAIHQCGDEANECPLLIQWTLISTHQLKQQLPSELVSLWPSERC